MKTKFTETKTWKKWRSTVLSNFQPHASETKPLFALLLAATSPTNLEQLSINSGLPDTCRPSVELKRALKEVWKVMESENERWVIMVASLEGLGLGIGFTRFYWRQLSQGKPTVTYNTFHEPDNNPDRIYPGMDIARPGKAGLETYKAEIDLDTSAGAKFLRKVEVNFYYSGRNEIFVVISFDGRVFTEGNAVTFKKIMPPYSLFMYPNEYLLSQKQSICYRISVTLEEFRSVIESNDIPLVGASRNIYYQPKDGFLEFVKSKLREIGIPFADTLVAE